MPSKRNGVMLCYPFEERRFHRLGRLKVGQPKIEGDRCRAVIKKGGCVELYSSSSIPITSMPHIEKALMEQFPNQDLELDGELYHHGWTQGRINSMCTTKTFLPHGYDEIEYWVYDIVNLDPQMDRLLQLRSLKPKHPLVHVGHKMVETTEDAMQFFEECRNLGFEGAIFRSSIAIYFPKKTPNVLKMKPRVAGEYPIVGYTEEYTIHGEPKNALGAFTLQTPEGELFNVGTGFTREQRLEYWQRRDSLIGWSAKIRFQDLTERLIPYALSFVKLIDPSTGR